MMKPNWALIKNDYEQGAESLRQLAKRYGVPSGTVCARAAKESWRKQVKQQPEPPLASAQRCVEQLLAAVQQALRKKEALQTTQQVKCKCKTDSNDGPVERSWVEEQPTGTMDIEKIRDFTAVLEHLVALKRDLFDLPTGTEAERRQLAREKLEMAKQKLEPNTAPQLRVLFTDEALEWAD